MARHHWRTETDMALFMVSHAMELPERRYSAERRVFSKELIGRGGVVA